MWRGYNKNVIYWAFYCMNDGKDVGGGNPQVIKCLCCCISPMQTPNPSTKTGKVL
jgi:hypothetical protein